MRFSLQFGLTDMKFMKKKPQKKQSHAQRHQQKQHIITTLLELKTPNYPH